MALAQFHEHTLKYLLDSLSAFLILRLWPPRPDLRYDDNNNDNNNNDNNNNNEKKKKKKKKKKKEKKEKKKKMMIMMKNIKKSK